MNSFLNSVREAPSDVVAPQLEGDSVIGGGTLWYLLFLWDKINSLNLCIFLRHFYCRLLHMRNQMFVYVTIIIQ